MRKVFAETRIPCFEQRKQFMADTIARERHLAIGRVFAPRLVERAEIGFDFGAGGGEERTKNLSLGKLNDGMDPGEAFGPRAAQEFSQNGFGSVVESVRG